MVEQLSSSHHLLADAIISLTLARLVYVLFPTVLQRNSILWVNHILALYEL
jgi:hypothetical protein